MSPIKISHPPSVHSVLSKLIVLTNERDVAALEFSLAQALYDLIASYDNSKSVTIYHVTDIKKQLFSAITIGNKPNDDELSSQFKQTIASCFMSGEYCVYVQDEEPSKTLYPLKNAIGHTMAIIAIEAQICDQQMYETISMLLQIYQNFTGLINDNERDTLTGLLNRKTFEHKINKVLAKMQNTAKRKDDKASHVHFMAIFDIDHFKNVNDDFGHLMGDEVLLMFSQLMTQTYRDKDLMFRFGGEEFVGVFECTSPDDIQPVLDRFREIISKFEFPQVGKITVSAGYTIISANDDSSQLIDRADVALYFAKNNGRDRVCHYEKLVADGVLLENKKEGDIELFDGLQIESSLAIA